MFGYETVLQALKVQGGAFRYQDWTGNAHIRLGPADYTPPAGWVAVEYTPTQAEQILPRWESYTRI